MTGNSDGLSPSLKPFLGIGHNRALPAPFGFDNCWKGDGVNDSFSSAINFKPIPSTGTFEFWTEDNTSIIGIRFHNTATSEIFGMSSFSNDGGAVIIGNITLFNQNWYARVPFPATSGKTHWCFVYDLVNKYVATYRNGVLLSTNPINSTASPLSQTHFNQFRIGIASNGSMGFKLDEMRVYNIILSAAQVQLNYNNGVGENPCVTEFLDNWYKFEEFENLDFSVLKDNSDIRLGMRDFSGKGNHLQPISMDTNPASPNYVLKPF
jgi:hypothetical protein